MDLFDIEYGISNLSTTFNNFTVFYDFPNKNQQNPTDHCNPVNMDEFNCSVEQYLLYARGSKQQPLVIALPMTILYVCIFVTGVLGNLIVCIVIVRHATMHTATNYYLFSLAVSDLIFLLLGLPYELSLYWHQYPYNLGIVCCKLRALISEAFTYVSVLTIVAFSMERFLAICYPLHLHTMSGLQRPVRIIAVLWIVSFICAVPFAIFSEIDIIRYPIDNSTIPDSAFCAVLYNPTGLLEFSSCVFFVIPMVVMVIMYGKMGLRIRTRQTSALGVQRGTLQQESRQANSRRAIIRMLATVVIAFFICWAPFHLQRLLYLYCREWEHYNAVNAWVFSVTGILYYVSCTINPILYNVMSHRYRVAFRETLCGKKRGHHYHNGLSRDQSSFRETTNFQDTTQLVRLQSVVAANRSTYNTERERNLSLKSSRPISRNSICKSKNEISPQQKETQQSMINSITEDGCNTVVVRMNNGRPKSFTTKNNYLNNNDTGDNDNSESIGTIDKIAYNIETCI